VDAALCCLLEIAIACLRLQVSGGHGTRLALSLFDTTGTVSSLAKGYFNMQIRKTLLSGIFASSLALGGAAAFSQESTPPTEPTDNLGTPIADLTIRQDVPFIDAEGNTVAHAEVREDEDGKSVWVKITSAENTGLAEGKYGVHIHERGVCDPADAFESAGGHFNPTDESHGDINADPSHGGDLGNLQADGDGNFEHEVLAEKITMERDLPNTIADEDGSAIVIHTGEDDLATDPSGNSGDRWACAIIFPAMSGLTGTPVASPMASPAGSPAATPAG
jgi:Cu-Zn family superoxide dismutase